MSGTGSCPDALVRSWCEEIGKSEAASRDEVIPYGLALHVEAFGGAVAEILHLYDYAAASDHRPLQREILLAVDALRDVLDRIEEDTRNLTVFEREERKLTGLMGALLEMQETLSRVKRSSEIRVAAERAKRQPDYPTPMDPDGSAGERKRRLAREYIEADDKVRSVEKEWCNRFFDKPF